ncbi:hypothetical protein G7B40_000925 [Aetokthonos hydrillicola Thurmond2011]|uniref:Uncharacterized protein n=1 Tax=Aetokthonos hydrillicola Thurmond2011 TaxID=2712845 RepID=A0AAP5M830_9CYAN|nr:hypothetical protein [Aetokthonos hydrillicola]MBO3463163.1 hypothetical protein [Aetokthonos hydrillicola CCALA 1050]MBW4588168.1 hypothetical protein [Aetokthonos hydrillicola CCALA 1050]MDR9893148.1 hypothetical protein [Aetokthonos hydrillicola Thurmond2011]
MEIIQRIVFELLARPFGQFGRLVSRSRPGNTMVQTREIFVRVTPPNLIALTNSCVAYREPSRLLGVLQAHTYPSLARLRRRREVWVVDSS